MEKVILIKNGELALKGQNRSTFEDILVKNIKRRLMRCGHYSYQKAQSTIIITPEGDDCDIEEAVERVRKTFGIAAFSVAALAEKNIEDIKSTVMAFLGDELREAKTFKVAAKRSDKAFPFTSPEICNEVGGFILSNIPSLKVDVHEPDIIVTVEVRDKKVFVHGRQVKGAGGMPVSTAGKADLLLSGGIDSPVAGYMMAKRGMTVNAIHFVAPPYTSARAELKVRKLAEIVSEYSGRMTFIVVRFTEIEEAIKDNCPEELFTVILRRMMMKAANMICEKDGAKAIITGESLGQVASQTIDAITCTDAAAQFPVFRPCIGMDKEEIIKTARKIGSFETSLEPYEDCCTVFTPRHPRTRPSLELIENAEAAFDFDPLIEEAVRTAKYEGIN